MKTINKINLLTIVFIISSNINCNSQIKTHKQKEQQTSVAYPEAELVSKDVGTLNEEIQGELQIALGNNDIEELTILLRKGAFANKLPGNTDMSPLMLAETKEIAQLLLKNGANPLVSDANGQNLLHYAVSKENVLDLIPLYASLGVDANAQDLEKNTPLLLAIIYFEETNAFDSEPVFLGEENNNAEEKAVKPNPTKILKALAEAGANLNAFNEYGYTLLMNCVSKDNYKLVEILLALGADKNIQNKYGETAKDIAYDHGKRAIHQLLE